MSVCAITTCACPSDVSCISRCVILTPSRRTSRSSRAVCTTFEFTYSKYRSLSQALLRVPLAVYISSGPEYEYATIQYTYHRVERLERSRHPSHFSCTVVPPCSSILPKVTNDYTRFHYPHQKTHPSRHLYDGHKCDKRWLTLLRSKQFTRGGFPAERCNERSEASAKRSEQYLGTMHYPPGPASIPSKSLNSTPEDSPVITTLAH